MEEFKALKLLNRERRDAILLGFGVGILCAVVAFFVIRAGFKLIFMAQETLENDYRYASDVTLVFGGIGFGAMTAAIYLLRWGYRAWQADAQVALKVIRLMNAAGRMPPKLVGEKLMMPLSVIDRKIRFFDLLNEHTNARTTLECGVVTSWSLRESQRQKFKE